jgi:hypothetical protein
MKDLGRRRGSCSGAERGGGGDVAEGAVRKRMRGTAWRRCRYAHGQATRFIVSICDSMDRTNATYLLHIVGGVPW